MGGGNGITVFIVFASVILSNAFLEESYDFPAIFVIGESLVENGNNNYLKSFAKSNYFPYGIDYPQGPSGRFNNGKTIADFLAYAEPLIRQKGINRGVNFASAAGGILEGRGGNLGEHLSFATRLANPKRIISILQEQMSEVELTGYLAKSLAVVVLGSNGYINNYLIPSM